MFKMLAFSFAILAGSAAMAQTPDPAHAVVPVAGEAAVAHAPRQMAGPVKIRFRKLSDVALAAVLANTPAEPQMAVRQSLKNLPID